jgi:hypothetical protein
VKEIERRVVSARATRPDKRRAAGLVPSLPVKENTALFLKLGSLMRGSAAVGNGAGEQPLFNIRRCTTLRQLPEFADQSNFGENRLGLL